MLEAEREHSEMVQKNYNDNDKALRFIVEVMVDKMGEDWMQLTLDETNRRRCNPFYHILKVW